MKIMVADDDRDMVDMLSYWLKGHGYDVVRAFDGEQAIKRWRETLPDLVILDIEMPKLDGLSIMRPRVTTGSPSPRNAGVCFLFGFACAWCSKSRKARADGTSLIATRRINQAALL